MNIIDRFPFITSLRFSASDVKLFVFVQKDSDITNLVKFLECTYYHSYDVLEESGTIPNNTQLVSSLRLRDYAGFCSYLYSLDSNFQVNTLSIEIENLIQNKEYELLNSLISNLDLNKISVSSELSNV